jgi:cephalosporin hydroxylase
MSDEIKKFEKDCEEEILTQGNNNELRQKSIDWLKNANNHKYSYHFKWMNRPIIQYPQDIQMMQELIMEVKPDLIIETGIAHGGSILFSASMLALLDLSDSIGNNENYDISKSQRKVLALDIDIREHNKKEILNNPFSKYIEMLEGSSTDDAIIDKVHDIAKNYKKIIIFLDSNHTHEHVLTELNAYAELTSVDSYIVVFDTVIDYLPENHLPNDSNPSMSEARTYTKGNSPMSAVKEYLENNKNFEIDSDIDSKLLISVAPGGYLKRLK